MVCLKKMFNGEITWYLKRRLKRLCHYKWKAWYIFIIHQLFYLKGAKNIAVQQYSEKERIESLYFSEGKRHFSYTIWLMISEKSIMVYTFLHHGDACHVPAKVSANKAYRKNCLLEFPIAWTHIYIQKEGISKHFGKEIIQLVWTVVTCLILNIELNMILIVLMEFACIIRHSWTSQQINLTVC